MAPMLSIIIVSWNTRDLLHQALASVKATTLRQTEIIVVDNGSTDGSPEMVKQRFPDVRLVCTGSNLGFSGGNNRGMAVAAGEKLFLLNSDTRVLPGAIPALASYLDANPDVGMVGPRLLNGDGTIQSSRRRFPTLPVLFLESTWLQPLAPKSHLDRYYVRDVSDSVSQPVDWITGAAMMLRHEVYKDVGGFDEGFFMYSEELDWCRRIHAAGWKVAYTPDAEIVHFGGKSSDQVKPARHIYFQTSKVRYTRKYHGKAAAVALRIWLLGQYVWQIALEGVKWLVGHRRAMRAERVAAYVRVLRSGLR